WRNAEAARDTEPVTEIVPERHAQFGAGFAEAEEGITAISSQIAACSGADLPTGDLATDIVFGAVGVQRDLRPFQHPQQFGLVGMQPRQQAIQRDEAGAAAKDAVEPRAQTTFARCLGS